MTTPLVTSFSKLFELPNKRQLAAYIDPQEENPGLIFVCEASGVTATTTMNLKSKENDAPLEEQRAGLAALLDLIDEKKAQEIFSILENTLSKHIPHLKILEELTEMAGQARKPFARIVEGPTGESVLLIRGINEGTPYLQGVTSQEVFKAHLSSVDQRDELFLHNQSLPSILPTSVLDHLGISPAPAAAPGRKPGM